MPIAIPVDRWAPPCLFCEVIAGRFEKGVVEETPLTITLVNGAQFEEGQLLVVPRQHSSTLLELAPEELEAVMFTAHRMARALMDAYDPDGILILQNNGVASGQAVPHYHMHIIPRRAGSVGWGNGPPQLAEVLGLTPIRPAFDPWVGVDREREIAAHIRRFL